MRQENPKKPLPSQSFSSMLHKVFGMADDSMIDKIFAALDGITGFVTLKTFVRAMSLFLRGSLKEKIVYCFKCYNLGGLQSNNKIHREHIMILLRNSVYKHQIEDVEEELKDLCEIILKKLDIDLDGVISLSDFKQSVEKQPLLLECFGQCLPDRKHCFAFLTTFTDPKRF